MSETRDGKREDERQGAQPTPGQPVVESLTVRLARASDRDAVFAFCARTWGDDGDYIPYVWDEWLADMNAGHGALLVAVASAQDTQSDATGQTTQAERPVGLLHVRMVSDDEAWIEGVRVDPAERRQGVGRSLVSRGLVAARERGATVARIFTDASNVASQRLFGGFGFTRVAELLSFRAPALTFENPDDGDAATSDVHADATDTDGVDVSAVAPSGQPGSSYAASRRSQPSDSDDQAEQRTLAAAGLADDPVELRLTTPGLETSDRIWEWLVQSNLTPFNGGLELRNWTARALTEANLRGYLANGQVLLLEGWDTILALAILGEDAHADEDADNDADDDASDDDIGAAANDAPTDRDSNSGEADGGGQAQPHRHARGAGALNVLYLDGTADGLSRLCLTLREVAGERGFTRVNCWLPDLLILRDAMDGAGYERRGDEAMYVYARGL